MIAPGGFKVMHGDAVGGSAWVTNQDHAIVSDTVDDDPVSYVAEPKGFKECNPAAPLIAQMLEQRPADRKARTECVSAPGEARQL